MSDLPESISSKREHEVLVLHSIRQVQLSCISVDKLNDYFEYAVGDKIAPGFSKKMEYQRYLYERILQALLGRGIQAEHIEFLDKMYEKSSRVGKFNAFDIIMKILEANNSNPSLWYSAVINFSIQKIESEYKTPSKDTKNLLNSILFLARKIDSLVMLGFDGVLRCKYETFLRLLNIVNPDIRNICDRAIEVGLRKEASALLQTLSENAEYRFALSCVNLLLINQRKFTAASLIADSMATHAQSRRESAFEKVTPKELFHPKRFLFPDECKGKEKFFASAYEQMVNLLGSPDRCVVLLGELNVAIKNYQEINKVDYKFERIHPGNPVVFFPGLRIPSACQDVGLLVKDTGRLLLSVIREKLNKFGIDAQPELYSFSGFVDPVSADEIVKKGSLFKEQFFGNISLIHGIYSHYLQWYIFSVAVEQGVIVLNKSITLKDLLTYSVMIKRCDTNENTWLEMLDKLPLASVELSTAWKMMGSSPMHLQSEIFFSDQLPYLRGCLLNSFYKSFEKYQKWILNTYRENISYYSCMAAQSFAYNNFGTITISPSQSIVAEYYRETAKIKGAKLDEKTGILTKEVKRPYFFHSVGSVSVVAPQKQMIEEKVLPKCSGR